MTLKNKTILITGSTDGIGKQTAIDAAKLGANIIIHGRKQERIDQSIKEVSAIKGASSVFGVKADFGNLAEVNAMVNAINKNYSTLDIIFNNAAEFVHNKELTKDGFERTFQVNYLAHFLLTEKLLPIIKDVEASKILNVSSMIHSSAIDFDDLQGEKNYSGNGAYSLSKLLNILHANKLADILEKNKTKVHSLHPGVIETKLLNAAWSGGMPVSEGAQTMLYAATSPITEQMSGLYLENRRPMQSNPISYDKEIQDKLWEISREMLKDYIN